MGKPWHIIAVAFVAVCGAWAVLDTVFEARKWPKDCTSYFYLPEPGTNYMKGSLCHYPEQQVSAGEVIVCMCPAMEASR